MNPDNYNISDEHPAPDSEESEQKHTTLHENEDLGTGDELFERQEFVADPRQSVVRIDKFLMERLANRSRSKVQNAIRAGSVTVDDKEIKPNYKVKPGNTISIVLPRALDEMQDVLPQNIPIDIVYEDEDVMIVNKPYNMAVHPGVGIPNGTLVNAVAWHLQEQLESLPVKEGNEPNRAGIVHRIDKDTTGLMVVAKNDFAMASLAKQFFHHTIERRYTALVWGDLPEDSGVIRSNIGRNPNDRKLFMVFPEGEDGKFSITHWKVIERFYYVTLVECRLETGRTHQIRVHMKSIGHTLFGDPRYGGNQILKGTLYSKYKVFAEKCLQMCPRQALHARVLGFTHPRTGEHIRFESALPADMQATIDAWRAYVQARKETLT
ncbi:MAG: RluA family pseudouridine synthase [Bacteroidetes bacterium]|nr:RluA family pseudouridine synthase [Bacteroidota bacterium]